MFRNPDIPFTYNYSQPEEYRFSIDSIEMPWEIARYLSSSFPQGGICHWNVLDLCAGCGVLGFELNFHIPPLMKIDFVEVQSVYEKHFVENLANVEKRLQELHKDELSRHKKTSSEFRFLNLNYEKILLPEFEKRYQLILCNPPYFFPDQGKLSPSEFKNRCRFFIDSSFEKLIETIDFCLAMEGEAFILLREQEDYSRDILTELRQLLKGKMKCENFAMIRGTMLLKLYR